MMPYRELKAFGPGLPSGVTFWRSVVAAETFLALCWGVVYWALALAAIKRTARRIATGNFISGLAWLVACHCLTLSKFLRGNNEI